MEEIKAVVLAGGLGTRLRSAVPSLPKALASVGDKPFLELLVQQLSRQGIRRLVMCTGYLGEQIEEVFQDGTAFDVHIAYSREATPMGTGGALKLAETYVETEAEFFVLNGDSFLEVDFNALLRFHREHNGWATMAVIPCKNTSRYGTVRLSNDGRVEGFVEKTGHNTSGIINAGVYVFSGAVLAQIPDGPTSLERDVFPKLLEKGIYASEQQGTFIDIGIPEDYELARSMSDRLADASLRHYSSIPRTVLP